MLESFRASPTRGGAAVTRRTVVLVSVVALVGLAVAQLLSYPEGGWNPGLILLFSMIVANLLWRYRRRE